MKNITGEESQNIAGGSLCECLIKTSVKSGDVWQAPPGFPSHGTQTDCLYECCTKRLHNGYKY